MDIEASSVKNASVSLDESVVDPEEKEISDDDDDDRNHKHRRRDIQSQTSERETFAQFLLPASRKRNRPLENGHMCGRGRGRDAWNARSHRFGATDTASPLAQHGSVTPNLFTGRGLSTANVQNASWGAFGFISGLSTNGMDALHPFGLHGALRPSIASAINTGLSRQRCRDFEERGFCLRGDMCPMEHGINRIVVEDVQSLSQFNLPVSLPTAHIMGMPAGSGPGLLHSSAASPSTSINNRISNGRNSRSATTEDLYHSRSLPGSVGVNGSELYDPDQPLWNNNCPDSSGALLSRQPSKNVNTESLDTDTGLHQPIKLPEKTRAVTSIGARNGNFNGWGRINSMKSKIDNREGSEHATGELEFSANRADAQEHVDGIIGHIRLNKQMSADNASRIPIDTWSNRRKAHRTLFITGIPPKNNIKEALHSHFNKFGMVIDVHIPLNAENAFVQFSKREEAEAALNAPDAVMGNRFIRTFWANRDNTPENFMGSVNVASTLHPRAASTLTSSHLCTSTEENEFHAARKASVTKAFDASIPPSPSKQTSAITSATASHLQKKFANVELLEQLRKKQKMLEQKRNDFRRQLDKLEKILPATGIKNESSLSHFAKKQKSGSVSAAAHTAVIPNNAGIPSVENMSEVIPASMPVGPPMPNNLPVAIKEQTCPVQPEHTAAPLSSPTSGNKLQLGSCPTSFKVIPPLPTGFANEEDVVKQHFSSDDVIEVQLLAAATAAPDF